MTRLQFSPGHDVQSHRPMTHLKIIVAVEVQRKDLGFGHLALAWLIPSYKWLRPLKSVGKRPREGLCNSMRASLEQGQSASGRDPGQWTTLHFFMPEYVEVDGTGRSNRSSRAFGNACSNNRTSRSFDGHQRMSSKIDSGEDSSLRLALGEA